MLKTYCDGSENYRSFLTLSTVTATVEAWDAFDQRWQAAFERVSQNFDSEAPFHTTDLVKGRNRFKNLKVIARKGLVSALRRAVEKPKGDIFRLSCTVDLAAHSQVKAEFPQLPTPHELCVNVCIAGIVGSIEVPNRDWWVYFDQDEKFLDYLDRMWRDKTTRWIRDYLGDRPEPITCQTYALQAADFYAWLMNRYHSCMKSERRDYWWAEAVYAGQQSHHFHAFLGEADIRSVINKDGTIGEGGEVRPVEFPVLPVLNERYNRHQSDNYYLDKLPDLDWKPDAQEIQSEKEE